MHAKTKKTVMPHGLVWHRYYFNASLGCGVYPPPIINYSLLIINSHFISGTMSLTLSRT